MPVLLRLPIRTIVALLFLGASATAAPYRIDFVAQYQNQRVAGAEACFLKSGDGPNPFDHFLRTNEVRCMPADDVIEIPVGRWIVYGRHASGLISNNPIEITNPAPGPPRDVFSTSILDLARAGVIDVKQLASSISPDDALALYFSNAGTPWLPMLVPIPRTEPVALAPANVPVLILRMRGGRPTAVSDPLNVPADTRITVDSLPSVQPERRTVVTWVEFPQEERKPAGFWRQIKAPTATLTSSDGKPHAPLLSPGPGFGADGALLVFRDVPLGEATIRVGGDTWAGDQLAVEKAAGGVLTTSRGLVVRPAAALTARWTEESQPPPSAPSECAARAERPVQKRTVARLYTCDGLEADTSPDRVDLRTCKGISPAIEEKSGTARFTSIRPGLHLLVVKTPSLAPQRKIVTLGPGDDGTESVVMRAFTVFGHVTLGGHPVRTRVEFRTGSAVSDATGAYFASLSESPRALPVRIVRCEDGRLLYTHLPAGPVPENQPYDIDIPENHIEIHVVDDDNRAVSGATVQAGVFNDKDADAGEFVGEIAQTDTGGVTHLDNAPLGRELTICAQHEQYERACTARFSIARTREDVTVKLRSKNTHSGRIVSDTPLQWARVYFVRADGTLAEWTRAADDGTFTYRMEHRAPEYVVVASSAPLLVFPLPQRPPESMLEIRFPPGPVLDIEVRLSTNSAQADARIGLMVGGRYVPEIAYGMHPSARGLQPNLYGRGPLRIVSVLMTVLPVTVLLGPPPDVLPPGVGEGTDIFTNAAFTSHFPAKSTTASGRLTF